MSSDPAMISRMIHQEEEEVNSIVSKIKDKLTQHGVRSCSFRSLVERKTEDANLSSRRAFRSCDVDQAVDLI